MIYLVVKRRNKMIRKLGIDDGFNKLESKRNDQFFFFHSVCYSVSKKYPIISNGQKQYFFLIQRFVNTEKNRKKNRKIKKQIKNFFFYIPSAHKESLNKQTNKGVLSH